MILSRLVIKSPKLAEEILNQKVTSTPYNEDFSHVAFDFGLLKSRNSDPETQPLLKMLDEGQRDLIKHPLSESFIILKWQKLNWLFYAAFCYAFILAFVITLSALAEVSRHPLFVKWAPVTRPGLIYLLIATYIPAFIQLAFETCYQRSAFFNWVQTRPTCPPIPIPSLAWSVQCGLLASVSAFVTLILTQNPYPEALIHTAVWSVFWSWILLLLKIYRCPCLGIYVYILKVVLQDVLAFFLAMLALILGFAFSLHLLLQQSQSPFEALLTTLKTIVGHYQDYKSFDYPGTTEIIILNLFLLLSICVMNILIGLCVANVKDILMQKEDFKLGQMILNNFQTEVRPILQFPLD